MKIAVTGAMGTGKSTLVAWLAEHLPGYEFFNVDTLVAQLYDDPFFVADLMERFGVAERKAVSKIVFEDPEARIWLEDLASEMLSSKLGEISARPRVVVEFPLLFEMAAPYAQFDVTVATWCPPDVQRERITARDNRDLEHTERMLAAQLDADTKAVLADVVVDMTYGPDETVLHAIETAFSRHSLKTRCAKFFGTDGVWPVITALYGNPEREAHNLTYLARRLASFDEHKHLAADPRAVELAIWFHAAGQSLKPTHYRESPKASVKLLWSVLAQTAPRWLAYRDTLPLASELILTQYSLDVTSARLLAKPEWAADAALFLDLAMLDYAMPLEALPEFWYATQRELSSVAGLASSMPYVLLLLLARETLLHTTALQESHEEAVRAGIQALLELHPEPSFDDGEDGDDDDGNVGPGEGRSERNNEFNVELHNMQDQVYAGTYDFKESPADKAADDNHTPKLPAWPANKRNTPYNLD